MLHSAFHEHAVDVHVPGDADVGGELVGERELVAVDVFGPVVVEGEYTMQSYVLAERRVVFKPDAVFGDFASGGYQAVESGGVDEVGLGEVLFVGGFAVDVEIFGKVEVEAGDCCEILAPVVGGESMVYKVKIDVPAVVDELVAQSYIVHEFVVGAFEHVHGVQCVEVAHFSRPEEAIAQQSAAPFLSWCKAEGGTIVNVWRVGDLCEEHVVAVVAFEGCRASQLETVEIVPVVGAEEHVDGGGIVLETTHCQCVFAETEHPVLVWMVGEVEEVGVVEERDRAVLCNDALAEEVAELVVEVAADDEVKVLAVESEGVADSVVLVDVVVVEIGACLESDLREDRREYHL